MPRLGDDIPMKLQLDGEETNKYVRATVRDQGGTQISGSPFNLAHVAAGLYQKTDVAMPNTKSVTVEHRVYSDSGYTTRDTTYSGVYLDKFELNAEPYGGATSGYEIDVEIETQEIC